MDRAMRSELVVAGTCDGNVDFEIFRGCAGNFVTAREIRYLRNFGNGVGDLERFCTEGRDENEVGFGGNVGLRGFLHIWRWDGGRRSVKCRLLRFLFPGRNRTDIATRWDKRLRS
jgi:hypothetical protein